MYTVKKSLHDVYLNGKRVLIRVDFNVPLDADLNVVDDSRIKASLPTIRYVLDHGAEPVLMAHLGRPKAQIVEDLRMKPVGKRLEELINIPVITLDECIGPRVKEAIDCNRGKVILLENLRFYPGEVDNNPGFSKELAKLADLYVDDAFGTSHRAHSSTVGVTEFLPSVMGFLMEKELITLGGLLREPRKPFVVVLGGNKVSDKLGVIDSFLNIADTILTGGGMCFTLIKSMGFNVGNSILEEDQVEFVAETRRKALENGCELLVPEDIVIADGFSSDASTSTVSIDQIPDGWMGLDIGPETSRIYCEALGTANTIFWNGPMGVFEWPAFENGTRSIAECVANATATTIVGGGDSDAALRQFGLEDKIDFVSTGGGAAMMLLEGRKLPAVAALDDR